MSNQCKSYRRYSLVCADGFAQKPLCRGSGGCHACGSVSNDHVPHCMRDEVPEHMIIAMDRRCFALTPWVARGRVSESWGDDGLMRICAVRYCLGRRTYVTWECANWLIATWAEIPERAKAIIKRDIEEEFARDDRIRAQFPKGGAGSQPAYYPLGDDCDRKEWERVRKLWVEA